MNDRNEGRMSAKEWRVAMGLEIPGVTIGEVKVVNKQAQKRLAESADRRSREVALAAKQSKLGELGVFGGVGRIVKTKKPRNHEEDDLTMQVTEYLELLKMQGKVVLFTHTPQETYTKSWAVKNKNTAMGVRAGLPDMIIVYPAGVLFLELKREKGGKATPDQLRWVHAIQHCYEAGGVNADIAHGWNAAKKVIDYWAEEWSAL